MAKPKASSLLDELKKLPPRSYAKRWEDKLPSPARVEWDAIKAAYRSGEIVCSGKVIADRFFAKFPDAPQLSPGQLTKYLRGE